MNYSGIINVDPSVSGYKILIEENNWDDYYGTSDSDPYQGVLVYQGDNMPAPAPGVYLFDISLKQQTYALVAAEDKLYIGGLNSGNGIWAEPPFEYIEQISPGVYQGSVTITEVSAWGFAFYLQDNWDYKLGLVDGKIAYAEKSENVKDDAILGPGTYTLTVDLVNGTYEFN
ncbi:MAG: hypothetical protein LIP01_01130 [Tannerellaceae bacterium]|nr:hypothetical protein [Tannerellaceae bacterium]